MALNNRPTLTFVPKRKKTPGFATGGLFLNGAGEETRTLDVHLGKVVLYQLSYTRRARCKD
jgi:hypothetical protein